MSDEEHTTGAAEAGGRRRFEPVPRHLRPTTLHGVVVALWVAVGLFTGAGLASVVGAVRLVGDDGLDVDETIAVVGQHAGAWFVAAVVALGAIAVVEALLLTLGHVANLEPTPDAPGDAD